MKKIFWIPFVAILFIGLIFSLRAKRVDIQVDNSSVATTTVYKNDTEGFSFSYPNEFTVADDQNTLLDPWQYNTVDNGNLVSKLLIPKTIEPNTNFSEAYFDVGVSIDVGSIKNCYIAPLGNMVTLATSTINGVDFAVFHYGDAGAGNFYDVTSYHTIHKGKCVVLESMIHSSNIGNYSPDQGIKEFDKNKVDKILENIINSFSFLN